MGPIYFILLDTTTFFGAAFGKSFAHFTDSGTQRADIVSFLNIVVS